MAEDQEFRFAGRMYRKVPPGVYEIPLDELGDLRLGDLHPHSSIHITSLPMTSDQYGFSVSVTNGGDVGDDAYLTIFGHVGCVPGDQAEQRMGRLRRAFLPSVESGALPDPLTLPVKMGEALHRGAGFSMEFPGRPDVVVREAVSPLLQLFRKLSRTEVRLFLCHASEDKTLARALASCLSAQGAEVWIDEMKIRVGDSIVEKINAGLETATHLAVLLSKNSVHKPWVKREFSAALMRQLGDRAVTVLPVRLDESPVPVILADIKYADCTRDVQSGFEQVVDAVFGVR